MCNAQLWEGEVDEAIKLLREAMGWVRNPKALVDLIGYLEKRRRVHSRLR